MKTLSKIKDELADKYWQCTFNMAKSFVALWQLIDLTDEAAKIYAEQFIDAAAEEALVGEYTTYGPTGHISKEVDQGYGGWWAIDKDSILKLKEQLK